MRHDARKAVGDQDEMERNHLDMLAEQEEEEKARLRDSIMEKLQDSDQ